MKADEGSTENFFILGKVDRTPECGVGRKIPEHHSCALPEEGYDPARNGHRFPVIFTTGAGGTRISFGTVPMMAPIVMGWPDAPFDVFTFPPTPLHE
ncbi:MAG TPA: hypothetical protein VG797_03330 [Phycisphaerales bacterium]|nr:hypothetical protein [Phycisphaerales bacterium]